MQKEQDKTRSVRRDGHYVQAYGMFGCLSVLTDLKLCFFQFLLPFTCSLWNSHFPAAPSQQSQTFPKKVSQLCTCLRQRNHECGQSDFWRYFSSSECIPRGISFALKALGLGFGINKLMIHLNYFKSLIHFSRFYQLSRKVMVPYS